MLFVVFSSAFNNISPIKRIWKWHAVRHFWSLHFFYFCVDLYNSCIGVEAEFLSFGILRCTARGHYHLEADRHGPANERPVAMETWARPLDIVFFFFSPPNGKVCGKSSVWPGDLFEFDLSENKSSSRVCLQDQEALGPPAEQQLHQRPARGAALSPTRESPFFFSFVLLPSSSVCWNTSKTTL